MKCLQPLLIVSLDDVGQDNKNVSFLHGTEEGGAVNLPLLLFQTVLEHLAK